MKKVIFGLCLALTTSVFANAAKCKAIEHYVEKVLIFEAKSQEYEELQLVEAAGLFNDLLYEFEKVYKKVLEVDIKLGRLKYPGMRNPRTMEDVDEDFALSLFTTTAKWIENQERIITYYETFCE
jgi:hypothetical protein